MGELGGSHEEYMYLEHWEMCQIVESLYFIPEIIKTLHELYLNKKKIFNFTSTDCKDGDKEGKH